MSEFWVIEFRYPETPNEPCYAGFVAKDNALGWAPTIRTAARFTDERSCVRTLENSYGPETQKYGRPVKVEA